MNSSEKLSIILTSIICISLLISTAQIVSCAKSSEYQQARASARLIK